MKFPVRIKRENIPEMKEGRIITLHNVEQEWDKEGNLKKDNKIHSDYTLSNGKVLKSTSSEIRIKKDKWAERYGSFQPTSLTPKDVRDMIFDVLKHEIIEGKTKDGHYNYIVYATYIDEEPSLHGYDGKQCCLKNKSIAKRSNFPQVNIRKMF